MAITKTFYSNGKLLITGEYLVLDGATALALPTKKGQSLIITTTKDTDIHWRSLDVNGDCWFEIIFNASKILENTSIPEENKTKTTLLDILRTAQQLNPDFLKDQGFKVTTQLDFPRNWGLGTSSTLLNNIAQWAEVDGFQLLEKSFGGSGYDIAAAQNDTAIFYTKTEAQPIVKKAHLPWEFKDQLFFVHLNEKQDSKEGISRYRNTEVNKSDLERITAVSKKLLMCYELKDFVALLESHENIISNIIGLPTVKERLFSDYTGLVKSLGAWGGDFVLATGNDLDKEYFRSKGYQTIVSYKDMILV